MFEPDHTPERHGVPPWVPPALTGLLAGCLLALMTWQVAVRGPFVAWDWPVHAYVDPRQPDGLPRDVLNAVAKLGGQRLYTLPVIVGVGAYVAYQQRRLRPLIAIGAGLATVFFIGYWIKFGLGRTPPASNVDILHSSGQAFPSGHTANATLTWFLLVVVVFGRTGLTPDPVRFRRWLTVAAVAVFVAGGLMTALDYHWFSDIPGGWALGLLALMIAVMVLNAPPVPWRSWTPAWVSRLGAPPAPGRTDVLGPDDDLPDRPRPAESRHAD